MSYGQIQRDPYPDGKSKIDEAKHRRSKTDKIMSPLWVLSPILGGGILTITIFLSIGFIFGEGVIGGMGGIALIIVGIIVWVFLVAYPWYLMIKRRTEHFKRDHLLMRGVIEHLEEKQSQSNMNLTQELATLRSIFAESISEESEKSPLLYTVLALVIPWLGILYVLYFLMKDVYAHHQRITAFMENTRIATNKLGGSLVVPSWKTLEKRNFVVYFLISCICGPFMYYWMYSIIKDYNEHFKNQWRFEDQIPTGSRYGYGSAGRAQNDQGGQGAQYPQPTSQYSQRTYGQGYHQQSQREKRRTCPDCIYQMRYIDQYDKWYCDNCQEYKFLQPQQKSTQEKTKNHCIDCGNKMRYIEGYDRWYCDNCNRYR